MAQQFDWMQTPDAWDQIHEATRDMTPDEINQKNRRVMELWEESKIIFNCFSTTEGILALELIRKWTIETPTFLPGSPTSADYGFFRSGENNLYFEIQKRIKLGKEGPPDLITPPTDEGTG